MCTSRRGACGVTFWLHHPGPDEIATLLLPLSRASHPFESAPLLLLSSLHPIRTLGSIERCSHERTPAVDLRVDLGPGRPLQPMWQGVVRMSVLAPALAPSGNRLLLGHLLHGLPAYACRAPKWDPLTDLSGSCNHPGNHAPRKTPQSLMQMHNEFQSPAISGFTIEAPLQALKR